MTDSTPPASPLPPRSPLPPLVVSKAKELQALLLDVDGVLTDGSLYVDGSPGGDGGNGRSSEPLKVFNVKDGLALKLAQAAGWKVGILSARGAPAVVARARELGLDAIVTDREDKGVAFEEIRAEWQLPATAIAFIGDDLPDLPALSRAGLSLAPSDAARDVRQRVDFVLDAKGGRGAVREAVERLLEVQGRWLPLVEKFLS